MTTEVPVQTLITTNLSATREAVLVFLPKLAIAVGLLVAGWVIATVVAFFIKKIALGLDSLLGRLSVYTRYSAVKRAERNTARILSYIGFWLVFLFFIVLAVQALGYSSVLPWMTKIANHIPSFITCAIIILFGYIISRVVRESIIDMTQFTHNTVIAHAIGGIIVFIAVLFGIQQLAINVEFLIRLFNLTYGIVLAGIVLAIALSVYKIMADLMMMKMITQHLSVGQTVEMADFSGTITAINGTCVTLTGTRDGRDHMLIVPAQTVIAHPLRIHQE